MPTLHETLAKSHPKLQRGRVWCRTCGRTQRVDSANALRTGWPKCCGYTMTIDAPDERTPAPSNSLFTDCGDVVIDPVCGSGSTIVAAKRSMRSAFGFEIKKDFHKSACEWLRREDDQGRLIA